MQSNKNKSIHAEPIFLGRELKLFIFQWLGLLLARSTVSQCSSSSVNIERTPPIKTIPPKVIRFAYLYLYLYLYLHLHLHLHLHLYFYMTASDSMSRRNILPLRVQSLDHVEKSPLYVQLLKTQCNLIIDVKPCHVSRLTYWNSKQVFLTSQIGIYWKS